MKVLVTGYAGQLGYEVVRLLESRGVPCRGVDMADFNLTDAAAVLDYVQNYAPDVIVHCAAYTNVDKAETEPEICAAVNGMGTLYMVRAALSVGAKMVYISTDYVFSGTGDQPFDIDDPYGPKNVYGVSKVQGEDADDPVFYSQDKLGLRKERKELCPDHAPSRRGKKGTAGRQRPDRLPHLRQRPGPGHLRYDSDGKVRNLSCPE